MREVCRGLRRFCIVTLGAAVRALNLLGAGRGYPRAGTGIEAGHLPLTPLSKREGFRARWIARRSRSPSGGAILTSHGETIAGLSRLLKDDVLASPQSGWPQASP